MFWKYHLKLISPLFLFLKTFHDTETYSMKFQWLLSAPGFCACVCVHSGLDGVMPLGMCKPFAGSLWILSHKETSCTYVRLACAPGASENIDSNNSTNTTDKEAGTPNWPSAHIMLHEERVDTTAKIATLVNF